MKKFLMVMVCVVVSLAYYGCKEKTTEDKLKAGASDAVEKADDAANDATDKAKDVLE